MAEFFDVSRAQSVSSPTADNTGAGTGGSTAKDSHGEPQDAPPSRSGKSPTPNATADVPKRGQRSEFIAKDVQRSAEGEPADTVWGGDKLGDREPCAGSKSGGAGAGADWGCDEAVRVVATCTTSDWGLLSLYGR